MPAKTHNPNIKYIGILNIINLLIAIFHRFYLNFYTTLYKN